MQKDTIVIDSSAPVSGDWTHHEGAQGPLCVKISLVEMPSFSFNINVYGGDITFMPGVEKWINWFIESRVLRPYVLPERLTVPVKFLYDPTLQVGAI